MSFKNILSTATMMVALLDGGAALASTLDAISGPVEFKLSGVTTGFFTQLGTNETTWGLGNITQITRPTAQGAAPLWSAGADGDFLGTMLYGIADLSIVPAGPNVNLYNVGAVATAVPGPGVPGCGTLCGSIYVDIFRRTSNPTWTTPSNRSNSTLAGYNTYSGVSDTFPLWLRLQLIPGISPIVTSATLAQTVSSATLPATGVGSFYANVIGGSAFTQFDTNGFATPASTSADMFGIFDLRDNTIGPNATCSPTSIDCFFGLIRDPVTANAIPEPGSIALLGLGLLLMSRTGLGRRRRTPARR
jgi:hypothetical protein